MAAIVHSRMIRLYAGPRSIYGSFSSSLAQSYVTAELTSESIALSAASDGTVMSYFGAETTLTVRVGGRIDTSNWTITRIDSLGVQSSLAGNKLTVTSLTTDVAYVTLTATQPGYDPITKQFTVSRVKQGSAGQGQIKAVAFVRSTAASVDVPTGGSFASPTPTTAGWSDGIPAGTTPLWQSTRIFTSDELTPQQAEWTTPQKVANTSSVKYQFSIDNTTWSDTASVDSIYMRTGTSADGGETWTYNAGVKIKGEKGDSGSAGTRTAVLDMYRWSTISPNVFPSGDSTYTWATGQFTAPPILNGWALTPPAPVQGQTLWIARTVFADSGTSATSTVTWSATSTLPISASGSNGRRTAFLEVYQWAASTPTTFPSGTSTYTWSTGAFTAPTTPNGWSLTPGQAVKGQTLWACSVRFADTETTTTSSVTWNTTSAYAVGASGVDGQTGASAQAAFLTATSQVFQVSKAGVASPASITFNASGQNVAGSPEFSVTEGTATLTGTGNSRSLAYSAMTSDTATISITWDGQTDFVTVAKVREGADGTNGTNGLTLVVSNEAHTLPSGNDGVVSSYANSGTTIQVYEGATALTAVSSITGAGQFTIGTVTQLPASTITVGARSYNTTTATVAAHSGMVTGTDSVVITYPISIRRLNDTNLTINKVQTVTKSKAGAKGDPGSAGDSLDIIFIRSTTQPSTPAASAGVPSGWYSDVASVPAGSGSIWSSVGTITAVQTNYTWQTPIKIQGSDGASGLSIVELTIFKRATSSATPTGGTYNFATKALTPPSGWSISVPSGTDPVYTSRATVSSTNPAATSVAVSGWTASAVSFQNGTNGTNGTNGSNGSDGARGSLTGYGKNYGIYASSWTESSTTTGGAEFANRVIYNMIYGATGTTGLASTSHLRVGDTVTLTNAASATSAITKYWSGSAWVSPGVVIDGNLLVNGTITADDIGAGTLTGSTVRTGSGSTRVQLESGTNELQVYISGTKRAWLGGNSNALLYMEPGTQTGVYVYTSASSTAYGAALHGSNIGNTASSYGVRGDAQGNYGIGVFGRNTATFGVAQGYGVYGESAGSGTGVYGKSVSGPAVHCDGVFRWGGYSYAAPNGSTSEFLRRDGTWAAPSGGGSPGVSSFNTRTGAVTLSASDVTSALGSTYVNNANYATSAGSASSASSATSATYATYCSNSVGAYLQTGTRFCTMQSDTNLVVKNGSTVRWSSEGGLVSDARHKTAIVPSPIDGLALVRALRVVDFKWRSNSANFDYGKTHTGFIAQEVRDVFPDVVHDISGTLTINKSEMIPLLVKAIQELSAEIDALKLNDQGVAK